MPGALVTTGAAGDDAILLIERLRYLTANDAKFANIIAAELCVLCELCGEIVSIARGGDLKIITS